MLARTLMVGLFFGHLLACSSDAGPESENGTSSSSSSGGGSSSSSSSSGNTTDAGAVCNASNCTGCCLNGACQTGITSAGCGRAGEACAVCSGKQICKANQACGVDPESMWRVQPASAMINTKNGASDWDVGGGAPDPYVQLWCPPSAVTPVTSAGVTDSFSPTWTTGGCTVKAKDLLAMGFAVQVLDEDVAVSDPIGAKITVSPTETELLAGSKVVSSGPLTSLRITFQQQ